MQGWLQSVLHLGLLVRTERPSDTLDMDILACAPRRREIDPRQMPIVRIPNREERMTSGDFLRTTVAALAMASAANLSSTAPAG